MAQPLDGRFSGVDAVGGLCSTQLFGAAAGVRGDDAADLIEFPPLGKFRSTK